MRKPLWGLITACISVAVFLALGYVGLSVYYDDCFMANTWINGVYCTGSSVEEVNEKLLEQTVIPETLTVIGYNQTGMNCEEVTWSISMEDIKFTLEYETGLKSYMSNQNPWSWTKNLTSPQDRILEPNIKFSELSLQEIMEQILSGSKIEADCFIGYAGDSEYVLYDGMHNRVDEEKAYEAVRNAILSGEESVNLIEQGCYYDLSLDSAQKATLQLWDKIKNYQENGPVYDFGNGEMRVSGADMVSFLEKKDTNLPVTDEDGCLVLKENCAEEWVASIAEKYDTYGKVWEFESTRGETVSVEGKTYGSTMNQEREAIWFEAYLQNLVTGKTVSGSAANEGKPGSPRVPEYTRKAYNGTNELGDTYIEVDMGAQKLYYYQDGNLMLETDVVSGNMRRRWDTPEGVNYVYNKQKNRILRGEGYATPVDFWMPVNGAIGIHDADWRDEFGGEIYKTDGSHGCINVPKEVMPDLYEMVEIGTPVVMFYGSDPYVTDESTQDS